MSAREDELDRLADWEHRNEFPDNRPGPPDLELCKRHGPYRPRTILDGDCPHCLIEMLDTERPFFPNLEP